MTVFALSGAAICAVLLCLITVVQILYMESLRLRAPPRLFWGSLFTGRALPDQLPLSKSPASQLRPLSTFDR